MSTRLAVRVRANDAITRYGLAAQLRAMPELQVLDGEDAHADAVTVVAVDSIDDGALGELRGLRQRGDTSVVLIASVVDDASLLAAVEAGVTTLLLRSEATPDTIVRAAARAHRGDATLPAEALASLLKHVSRLQQNVLVPRGLTVSGLTTRESEVLRLVADGMDTNEIASHLRYSSRTVKNILHDVTTRFCLRNRSHAVAFALRQGFI